MEKLLHTWNATMLDTYAASQCKSLGHGSP